MAHITVALNLVMFFMRATVTLLSFRTDRSGANIADPDQTAPDQGLHCLPFRLHLLDTLFYGKTVTILLEF